MMLTMAIAIILLTMAIAIILLTMAIAIILLTMAIAIILLTMGYRHHTTDNGYRHYTTISYPASRISNIIHLCVLTFDDKVAQGVFAHLRLEGLSNFAPDAGNAFAGMSRILEIAL
jgi:hypothetical protein